MTYEMGDKVRVLGTTMKGEVVGIERNPRGNDEIEVEITQEDGTKNWMIVPARRIEKTT